MSGQESIRGYLVQTLVALFEVISDEGWTSIRLEPGGEEEKADLIFELVGGHKRAIQVKSTAKTFQKAEIRQYAKDLEKTIEADEYRLVLVGSLGARVRLTDIAMIGKVVVPEPVPQMPRTLIAAAAHNLENWMTAHGYSAIPALARELLVRALTNSLEEISTGPDSESRDRFEAKLERWVLSAYPGAMSSIARDVEVQLRSSIGTSQQTLKQKACLQAFNLVDQLYEFKFLPKAVVNSSPDGFEFASSVRRCYSELIVACESVQVPNQFRRFMDDGWSADEIIDFWSVVRQELGFAGNVEHANRENPWIAHVSVEPSDKNPNLAKLEELAKKYRDNKVDD